MICRFSWIRLRRLALILVCGLCPVSLAIAQTSGSNPKMQDLNNALHTTRDLTDSGLFDQAIAVTQSALLLYPDQAILWDTLGDAQFGLASESAAAASNAGRSPATVPEIVQQYTDAVASYRRTLDINGAAAKPSSQLAAAALNRIAQALGKSGNAAGAADAYEQAIRFDPANTATYAYNEAAIFFNATDYAAAAAAADRAILADPNKGDAYYIKGQSLIEKATVEPGTSRIELPVGCIDAYLSYLKLAPSGSRADEVRGILASLGGKTTTQAPAPNPTDSYVPPASRPTPSPARAPAPSPALAPVVAAAPSPAPAPAPAPVASTGASRGVIPETQPADSATASTIPIPHDYALIFATDTYANWPHLENPVFDATALNDTLTSLYGFQVEELKNPTGEQILQKLTEYLHRHFEIQDQLMIVFSGHGYFDADLGQGFIAPADALRIEDDLGHRSLLAHETLMNYVNRIPAKHVVLVIDACFAGTLDRKIADSGLRGNPADMYAHATLPELLLRKESKRTRRYFASGGKDFVPDGLPGHHSPFISAFLVTLNQAADRKGYVTLDDLQQGLNTVNPEPRWGDIQDDNEPGADFLLLTQDAIAQLTKP
jgi:tetratricopeptide (TPR) repeat protein